MSLRRGPSRFINGIPAAYRSLDLHEHPVPMVVATLLRDTEYDLEDYKDRDPILIMHYVGEVSCVSLADLGLGLRLFQTIHGRSTWLKVSFFNGHEILSVELPLDEHMESERPEPSRPD